MLNKETLIPEKLLNISQTSEGYFAFDFSISLQWGQKLVT